MNSTDSSLKRSLSLPVVTFYGLGTIIGAGIYVLLGEVVAIAGYFTPIAFLMAAIIAAFSAFSYAELSSRFPLSVGESIYVQHAFGIHPLSISIGLLMVSVAIIASATLVKGFIGYFNYIVPTNENISIPILIITLGGIAAWGIIQSAWVAIISTLVEIAGLLLIIWVTGDNLIEVPYLLAHNTALFADFKWTAITAGAFIAFFAFLGFEDIVHVAEEVKDPTRNLPMAIFLSLVISTLLYIIISVAAIATVPPSELAGNSAPLALVYERAAGASPLFIVIVSIAAIVNGTLVMMIMASRTLYGMSRQQWLPSQLSRINHTTRTPLYSTALVVLIILAFSLWLPVTTLAITTSLFTLVVFFAINLSLLMIKRNDRQVNNHNTSFRSYPIWIPIAGIISSGAFILLQVYQWLI